MIVKISNRSEIDIDEIHFHVANDNLAAADRIVDSILRIFLVLADNPYAGASRENLRKGLRVLPCDKYLIFYMIESKCVQVLRVLHGARKIRRSMFLGV